MLGAQAPSVHHPRALAGCMLRSAQLARSHAPARCALVAAVLPVIQARRSCLCMPLRRAEAAAADFTCILLSHMLWGFLLQLMRANSRQLLFLKEELIDKKSLQFTRYSAGGAARGL